MLNVFDYYARPNELNRHDLSTVIDILWELEEEQLQPDDKGWLNQVLHIIKRSPKLACAYTQTILEEPWPEVEDVIIKDPIAATNYACYVLEKRWPDAEPIIMTNPHYAWVYATIVLKHRWIEAEPNIKTNSTVWHLYKKDFNIE
jgi:hypothetical protein